MAAGLAASSQGADVILAPDGAWTWYNDPRALYHNGILYVGYVASNDARCALSAYNPVTGVATALWTSGWTQRDDHNNPALLPLQDGRLLALYARHGTTRSFEYRWSTTTNPAAPADWSAEQVFTNTTANVTYCNPYQLSSESGRIYQFMRNLNFNPSYVTSDDNGATWSAARLLIQNGSGSTRPYVKYASDGAGRVDLLYTDGHPRDATNSLYHLYYEAGALRGTDGTLLKALSNAPMQHADGERGTVVYAYATAPTNDPNAWIPTGRAWCWQTGYRDDGRPHCVFTVQRDQVMGANWYDDRIYYYYARWTGSAWQKRFIAHAGRPLYSSEDDYAGGITLDPGDPNVIYIASNAGDPFDLAQTTNVPLRADARYEIWRGVTSDGGLTFAWEPVTTNSAKDNFRPYVPAGRPGNRSLVWFRGTYTTYSTYDTEVVGRLEHAAPSNPPEVRIVWPATNAIVLPNPGTRLDVAAAVSDDGQPGTLSFAWSTVEGPTNAEWGAAGATGTWVRLPRPGAYRIEARADDTLSSAAAQLVVQAGDPGDAAADPQAALWLKLDESGGTTAGDSGPLGLSGTTGGIADWRPDGGVRRGALAFNGTNAVVTVADADALDAAPALTLAFWFLADRIHPTLAQGLVAKRVAVTDSNAYTAFLQTDRRIYVDLDSNNNRFSSSTLFETGRWYHVAVTFDGSQPSASRAVLYVDGRVDRTAAESSIAIPNYASGLAVGNVTGTATNWLAGRMDDVRVVRRALSATEVAGLAARHGAPYVAAGAAPAMTNDAPAPLAGIATGDGRSGAVTSRWTVASGPGPATLAPPDQPATSVEFDWPGAYRLELHATNGFASAFDTLDVTVTAETNTYRGWAWTILGGDTNDAVRGPHADPDGDLQPNLVEFALGLRPDLADAHAFTDTSPGLPRPRILDATADPHAALEVRAPAGRLGIVLGAEAVGDLMLPLWTDAPESGTPVDHGDGTISRFFRDPQPLDASGPRFLRLRCTADDVD